jgi:hypothetical protein
MAKNTITALTERISKLQSSIADFDNIIADDGASMADEQLDQITRERAVAQARLGALQKALAGEQGKDVAAIAQAAQEARKAAGSDCAKAALERADAAADIDAHLVGLVAAIQRFDALNADMRRSAFDAGVADANARNHSADMRGISAVVADRLSRSGVAAKLDYIQVVGTQHSTATAAELTAKANAKLLGAVEKALA